MPAFFYERLYKHRANRIRGEWNSGRFPTARQSARAGGKYARGWLAIADARPPARTKRIFLKLGWLFNARGLLFSIFRAY